MTFSFEYILMIWIFTWIALSLFNTLDNISTPCSVNARGEYLLPPLSFFEVAICDLKNSHSSSDSWNIKSSGNLSIFRFTCSFSRLVST